MRIMTKYTILIMFVLSTFLVGCRSQIGDYTAAASISKDGFARDAQQVTDLQGQEVKLWGYVDHGNLYGDESAKAVLGEWWSGEGPDDYTWRFNLKASQNDAIGQSFAVYVPNDAGRDELLRTFLADAQEQRPTKVFLTGKPFTFEAPTNAGVFTGLYLELNSSGDVLLEPPG
jgi:hypothetical protein